MTTSRKLTILSLLCGALALLTLVAERTLTPDFYLAIQIVGRGLIANVVVQAALITLALVGLVSLCACAWERMDREYERRTAEPKTNRGPKAA